MSALKKEFSGDIPPMTDPLGRYWDQPNREDILVDETHAVMSEISFGLLLNYSYSVPTGSYVGKMWKAQAEDGTWYLRWYAEDTEDPLYIATHTREILLCR